MDGHQVKSTVLISIAEILYGNKVLSLELPDRQVDSILNELNRGGIADKNITIISATGDHRGQSVDEHRTLVGDEVFKRRLNNACIVLICGN